VAWVEGGPLERRPLELVLCNGLVSRANWESSQKVLKALHSNLSLKFCRTWMVWHTDLPSLLQTTSGFGNESPQSVGTLASKWGELIRMSSSTWEKIVKCPSIAAQQLDELEVIEHNLFHDDEEMRDNPQDDDVVNHAEDNGLDVPWARNDLL
ncbi:hypothetical protein DFH28DRAFT_910366, partial [Melampsora americana]